MSANQIGTDTNERQQDKPLDFPKGLKVYRIPVDLERDFHFAFPPDITESEVDFVVEDMKRFMMRLVAKKKQP